MILRNLLLICTVRRRRIRIPIQRGPQYNLPARTCDQRHGKAGTSTFTRQCPCRYDTLGRGYGRYAWEHGCAMEQNRGRTGAVQATVVGGMRRCHSGAVWCRFGCRTGDSVYLRIRMGWWKAGEYCQTNRCEFCKNLKFDKFYFIR
jgi:hypothetical protein